MKIITIGRSSSNDVIINDPLVTRKTHCQIIQDDNGSFRLIDNNSTNGTYVNGTQRHGEVVLNKTDVVRIGNTILPWQTYFNNVGHSTVVGPGRIDYTPIPPRPKSWLGGAIVATVLFSILFGILAIVNASKVDKLYDGGDYIGAQCAAQRARTFFWLAFGIGIGRILLFFFVM